MPGNARGLFHLFSKINRHTQEIRNNKYMKIESILVASNQTFILENIIKSFAKISI
jgi:hypothetical protein